jgi:hypothetical protein
MLLSLCYSLDLKRFQAEFNISPPVLQTVFSLKGERLNEIF